MRPVSSVIAVLAVAAVLAPAADAGGVPVQFAVSQTRIWAASDSGLHVLDTSTGRALSMPTTTYPYATEVVVGDGAGWIASISNGYLAGAINRIDLHTRRKTLAFRSPRHGIYGIAYAAHGLWVLLSRPTQPQRFQIARLDSRSRRIRFFRISGHPGWIAAAPDGLWISGDGSLRFLNANGRVNLVARIRRPGVLAVSSDSVWVTSGDSVIRFDPRSHRRLATVTVGTWPNAITAAAGRVWVTVVPRSGAFSQLVRINARTSRVTGRRVLSRDPKRLVEPTAVSADREHVYLGISGVNISAYRQAIVRFNAVSLAREKTLALR
jgi:hypothetical protein